MENYIEARVILGILCLIHIFAIYGAKCPWGHVKGKVLNTIIITELVVVTAYIIYDNGEFVKNSFLSVVTVLKR
jgi:hypothetical protein